MSSQFKAVVLLSGGLDSATTLYLAKKSGWDCHALVFDYGQRHRREINAARAVARRAGVSYQVVKIRLPWKGSALLDRRQILPKNRTPEEIGRGIPVTYVPARNTIFLSFALSFAETIGARRVYIGANALDSSGYPDCRPDYYHSIQAVARKGTKAGVTGNGIDILTPLINRTKADIVRQGQELGVPFALTWSCYEGGRVPCRKCDSCLLRAKGFQEAGVRDPVVPRPRGRPSKKKEPALAAAR